MMKHAYAPGGNPPPELFGRYILMKDYSIPWEDTGPPLDMDDIGSIAEMASVWNQAQEQKRMTKK